MTGDETNAAEPTSRRALPLPVRLAGAAVRWAWKSTRDFSYRSLHLTLYVAVVAGFALWAIQQPAVKSLLKAKVAHARDKYVLDGDPGRTPADLQARLDGLENSLQNQLTQLRIAAAQGGTVSPAQGPAAALPGRPADVRLLPYPFHSYLSVTSDPDGMTFADFESIHRLLEDTYQLPLSDQLFCCDYGSTKRRADFVGTALDLDYDADPPRPRDGTWFHRLLVAHNRGWLDGIHGWHARGIASLDESFRLEAPSGRASRAVNFEWGEAARPRDLVELVFEYRLPMVDSRATVRAGGKLLPVRGVAAGDVGMSPAVAWTPVSARVPADTPMTFTFAVDGPPGSGLEVRNAMVTNMSRARVAADAQFLAEYDLRYALYSEHARIRNELTAGLRKNEDGSTRPGVLVDSPVEATNFYALPEFERIGIGFINVVHQTGQPEALPITALIGPHRFNDGVVRYAFQRYYAYPLAGDGSSLPPRDEHSWEPWLGFHLGQLLAHSGRFGDGGTIYTHWGVANPKDLALCPATREQLDALRERYYNLSGNTPAWDRVWVSPTAGLLLYSRAMQAVRENASYDEATNTVHVRSWYDPVARQSIPVPRTRAFGLANLTFYVTNSATARLVIDGREYTCLKRNPVDHTGRESVTIIDDSVPTVVFDEVDPLHRFGDFRSDGAECYFRHTGGFRGTKCLEMVLQEAAGKTELKLAAVKATGSTYFRFAFRKTNVKAKVGVRVTFDDGSELLASEAGPGNETGWTIPPGPADEWRDCVFALTELERERPLKRIPSGGVRSITFEATDGQPGDRVFFDAIEFLRHPIHPPAPTGRHLVGGRVDPPTDGVKVVLEEGPNRLETKTNGGGYFYFPHAAETGSVVKVYAIPEDRQPRSPTAGRYLEVRRNLVELSIPLADVRDVRTTKLVKRYKADSELNAKFGRVYKPRSEYIHSGIGTPQEFENKLQINNLGFLDRDRRPENPDRARRVLFLGNCNLFGHSTPRAQHANILLEDLLGRRTGYPTEVIAMADSAMSFGKHWSYYRELGRPFKPEVVCIFLQSSGVEMMEADPETFARFYEYEPGHFPCSLFRDTADGGLTCVDPDPEYFRFVGKDPDRRAARDTEKKKGGYYSDGLDWITVYDRNDWEAVPRPARQAWDHFARVLRYYHDEMAKDGARLVIVLTPEAQLSVGGLNKNFTDTDGQPCNSRLLGERVKKLCRDLGVGYLNVTPDAVKALPDPGMYTWRHDGHPCAYGNRVLAESVCDYLFRTNFGRLPSATGSARR
jgi:hypothetical protein